MSFRGSTLLLVLKAIWELNSPCGDSCCSCAGCRLRGRPCRIKPSDGADLDESMMMLASVSAITAAVALRTACICTHRVVRADPTRRRADRIRTHDGDGIRGKEDLPPPHWLLLVVVTVRRGLLLLLLLLDPIVDKSWLLRDTVSLEAVCGLQ